MSTTIAPYITDIDTIIMCLECNNEQVLDACIQEKVNYIDITPTTQIIEKLLAKKNACEEAGITAMLGVGIAPGQSNYLAKQASYQFDHVESVDSYVMLGVGERHGSNSVSWLINTLNTLVPVYKTDYSYVIKSFHEKSIQTLQSGKKQTFTRINLADCIINQALFPEASCNSWFAYDVNFFTKLVCFMQRYGLFHLLRYKKMRSLYQKIFTFSMNVSRVLRIGTDQCEIIAKVVGYKNGKNNRYEIFSWQLQQ